MFAIAVSSRYPSNFVWSACLSILMAGGEVGPIFITWMVEDVSRVSRSDFRYAAICWPAFDFRL